MNETKSSEEHSEKLEKGMPRALWYFIIPSLLFLLWAMFFKSNH